MPPTGEKATVSARISLAAVQALKKLRVPLSDVIEAGIFHFLLLDDFAKVKFLIQNNEEVINVKAIEAFYREERGHSWPAVMRAALALDAGADVKAAIHELKSVAKNVADRGEEVFFRKRIAGLDTTALLQEAHLAVLRSSFAEALVLYESALRRFEAAGDEAAAGRTLASVGRCHQSLGRYSDALDAYEKARRLLAGQQPAYELAKMLADRGSCYQSIGRYDEACASYDEARKLFESLGNYDEVRSALSRMGACLNFMGDKERVLALYDMFIDRIEQQKRLLLAGMNRQSR